MCVRYKHRYQLFTERAEYIPKFNNAVMRGDDIIIPKIVDYEIKRGFRILHAPNKERAYKIFTGGTDFCDIAEMNVDCWDRAEHVYEEL